MSSISTLLDQGFREIRANQDLQRRWEVALCGFLAGLVLLGGRMLGSLSPDSDVIRGIGVLWFLNGTALLACWWLTQSPLRQPAMTGHRFCCAALLFSGAVLATLGLMPTGSFLSFGFCLLGLLISGVFFTRLLLMMPAAATETAQALPQSTAAPEKSITVEPTAVESSVVEPVIAKSTTIESAVVESLSEPEAEAEFDSESAESLAVLAPFIPANDRQQLIHWLTRKREKDGTEIVEGMVRLELAAGQTQRSAHIAFTPALNSTPEMECEPLGEVEVEAVLGDVYPHGFRVDIRRIGSSRDTQTVEIGFHAISTGQKKSAA